MLLPPASGAAADPPPLDPELLVLPPVDGVVAAASVEGEVCADKLPALPGDEDVTVFDVLTGAPLPLLLAL